jgi:DNA-directed RNA polymerase specialized sigma24 family protein
MRNESFVLVFESLSERLDWFFHKRLKSAGVRFEIEFWKEELMQETALAVLNKLKNERYEDYSMTELIFIKAKDVWANHARTRRKRLPSKPIDEESLNLRKEVLLGIEQKDEVKKLEEIADPESWSMFVMHSSGYNFKEIASHFRTTEGAVKMRVSRLKNKLTNKK